MFVNKKILTVLAILIVIVWLIFAATGVKKEESNKETKPIPTAEPTPIEEPSKTGALYISPSKDEVVEIEGIKKLKENCPIENNEFGLIFDYGTSKFKVKLKQGYKAESFYGWLENNGYGKIGKQYFLIEG